MPRQCPRFHPSDRGQILFITEHISLAKQGLALHIEFSHSPVDQVRQGWHRVARHSVRLSQGTMRVDQAHHLRIVLLSSGRTKIMSFAKFIHATLLLLAGLALNSLRSVRSVSLLVTLLIVLAAAQSNPVAQAHQPSALPGAQQPPAGVAEPPAGTFQPPPVHFKDVAIYN